MNYAVSLNEILKTVAISKVSDADNFSSYIQGAIEILNKVSTLHDDIPKLKMVEFIRHQLCLLTKNPNVYRYDSEVMVLSCLFQSISPHAYNFVRNSNCLILPHPRTLKKVSIWISTVFFYSLAFFTSLLSLHLMCVFLLSIILHLHFYLFT